MSEEKSMKDYENELERSFQVLREGDILDVTVIGVSDTEVTVDLNYYTEGIIPIEECSDDPSFSIKKDMIIGDVIKAMVLDPENASGNVILSRKEANRVLVWDELKEDMANGTVFHVKITEAVYPGFTARPHLCRRHGKLCGNDCSGSDHYGRKGYPEAGTLCQNDPEGKGSGRKNTAHRTADYRRYCRGAGNPYRILRCIY